MWHGLSATYGSRASLSTKFDFLEKAGVGVAPGVDFGQAGKRAVRFSYDSSEENIKEAARWSVDRFGPWLFQVARSLLGRWWACMAAGAM